MSEDIVEKMNRASLAENHLQLKARIEALEAKLSKMLEIVRRHDTGDMRREDMEARRILEKLEDVMKGDTNG